MRSANLLMAIVASLLACGDALAAGLSIGVAAPLSGPSARLGEQIRDGAEAAAKVADATITVADDLCNAAGGKAAAEQLVAANVRIVVGFLCTEAIEAAMPLFRDAGIPVITVGVRTDSLTDMRRKTRWPVFRLGPRADGERTATAAILTELWRDELFAIIDDGTIYGREMAESFRLAAEQAGLKPVFIDTFRPQLDNQIGLVGRLRKAEATSVFAGGDIEDIAIIARDAAGLGVALVIAGGEALRAEPGAVPLAAGTLMIGLPEWAETADPAIVARLREATIEPEGYVLPAYAAVQAALAADAAGPTPAEALSGRDFGTVLGPVRFDDKGDLTVSPYRAFRFDGTRFVSLETD